MEKNLFYLKIRKGEMEVLGVNGKYKKIFVLFFLLLLSLSFPLLSQETPNYEKILGAWDVEVQAEGEFYYLAMKIDNSSGELAGTISEINGTFSDVSLREMKFDGQTLSFEFTAPTPPDDVERLIKVELRAGEDRLEGNLDVEGLGVAATVTATRAEKSKVLL